MINVLIVYRKFRLIDRATIRDHLYSFKRYGENCRVTYLDVQGPASLGKFILQYPFDAVVFHYTFLAMRFDRDFQKQYERLLPALKCLRGYKVFLVHDEYLFTRALWRMIRDLDVAHVYATCYPQDYETLFPYAQTGKQNLCSTVFPGYVEETLEKKLRCKSHGRRRIDVGYRALQSDYAFGLHGYLKTRVALEMRRALDACPDLTTDIQMTGAGYVNTIVGNRWLRYLCSCRTAIGCLGGSSLMDPDGELRWRASKYMLSHPNASYYEVEQACYPGQDGTIQSHLFGPKIFECAMTRTCQILVEDDYQGILTAGIDYIPIRKDFSNLQEIIDRIRDKEACEQIAEQCYEHLVSSGRYSYRIFARGICGDLSNACPNGETAPATKRMALQIALLWNSSRCTAVLAIGYLRHCLAILLAKAAPALYQKLWQRRHPENL